VQESSIVKSACSRLSSIDVKLMMVIVIILSVYSFAALLSLSSPSMIIITPTTANAQPYVQTVKYRNLVVDLGNGLKTNAQLTIPALGKGPLLLLH
jgi:uncharacterized membrane protein YqhA